jgi:hypothetical protein
VAAGPREVAVAVGGGSNLVPPGGSHAIDTTGVPRIQISYRPGKHL